MSQWLAATASHNWSEAGKVRQPFRAVKGSGSQLHIINPICFPSLLRNTYHKGNQSCFSFSFWLVWMWIMSWSLSEWYAVLRNTYFYLCNIENALLVRHEGRYLGVFLFFFPSLKLENLHSWRMSTSTPKATGQPSGGWLQQGLLSVLLGHNFMMLNYSCSFLLNVVPT